MKDKLKNHIDENRADFEIYDSDFDTVWEKVDKRLKTQSAFSSKWIWRAAAAVLLVAVASYFVLHDGPNNKKTDT